MKTEEKIRDILNRHYGHEVMAGSDLWFTKQYQDRYAHLLEMAEWKEKQMIEKACKWLKDDMLNQNAFQGRLERLKIIDGIIERFKKAMEE